MSTQPHVSDPETDQGDGKRFTHLVSNEDYVRGYVFGLMITAVCGYRFVPSRDPEKYPRCERCKEILRMIKASGEN